ncbi:MAG: DNA polymerase I [Clostridia bacterium]|nr:DNA polymerase I [Clostridia bacterium]
MKIAVLDGNSLMNRAFYGIRLLTNSAGVPTNALLGFMNMLQKLREDGDEEGVIVCFDRKEPTFRHERYDGYKAGRKPMPEELARQMPLIKEMLDRMGIPRVELAGYEADDLLGTIAARNAAAGGRTVIVTGDRDSLQLVGPATDVKIMATSMGKPEVRLYTEQRIREDFGVTPRQLIEVKALMGDTSDNIPGVAGIGEKTALSLIAEYENLEKLYDVLEGEHAIKPAAAKKLAEGRASAFMSRELAEICLCAPAEIDLSTARWPNPEGEGLLELLSELELKSVITRLGVKAAPGAPTALCRAEYVRRPVETCRTTAFWLDAEGDRLALSDGEGADILEGEEMISYLASDGAKIGFDIKAAARLCLAAGREPGCFVGDVMLCGYLLGRGTVYEDIAAAAGYCDGEEAEAEGLLALAGGGDERLLCRAATLARLHPALMAEVDAAGMGALYRETELPLAGVLADMEHEGVRLDCDALRHFGEEVATEMHAAEAAVFEAAGHEFNLNSPKQLGVVLFEELRLPGGKKTKTGWSTDAETLDRLRIHPIVEAVLRYRQHAKLHSTYVESLLKFVDADGRVHTTFHQTGTATGRLSSSDPNMQNMPIRRELGGEIRRCFIPREGYAFADADYSQIELRILAHISGDERMCRAFAEGEDIHTITAAQVFGVAESEVTPQMRSSAKAVNFGIVYGISDFSLAEDIHVTRKEAGEYIARYFEKYPDVARYMEEIVAETREKGYVSTLFGRRRPVRDIRASNFNLRTAAERIARNTPIQGTAADVIKMAMVRVSAALKKEFPRARLLLQVHDELLCEAPAEEIEGVKALLCREMEAAASLSVRLPADGNVGDNWLACK